jgi:probable HAF family extracellular repeat protein
VQRAFLIDSATGTLQVLGTLPSSAPDDGQDRTGQVSHAGSYAVGINDSGQVAGFSDGYWDDYGSGDHWIHAFMYDSKNGMKDLGTLADIYPDGHADIQYPESYATGINSHGQIVGYSDTGVYDPYQGRQQHAFLYDPATGQMQDLGTLGGRSSGATGINDLGQVVGWSYTAPVPPSEGEGLSAFIYTPGTGMQNLDIIVGRAIDPNAINNSGQIVGSFNTGACRPDGDQHDCDTLHHAFLYDPATAVLTDLDGNPYSRSDAHAIDEQGRVVGSANNTSSGMQFAVLYYRGVTTDLGTIGGKDNEASGISGNGLVAGISKVTEDPDNHSHYTGHHAVLWTVDVTAPNITAPPNVTAEATGTDGAVVTFTSSALDDFDGVLPVTCTPASGNLFPVGATSVTCTATDAAANVGSASVMVTVQDTTAPVIASHANVAAETTSASGAIVTYTSPGWTDAVSGSGTANCTPVSGSTFPVGTTTVTCTAMDAAGNAGIATTFTVTVTNTAPPPTVTVTATPNVIWPPNKKMVPVKVVVTPADATARIIGVTCNEACTAADWTITGKLTVNLRADRNGNGTGRIYTIKMAYGSGSTATVQVKVPHDQGK